MEDSSNRTAQSAAGKPTRPHMPAYGISTDSDGMLPWRWVCEHMERSRNYWIASTRPDGRPHVTPVWGVWLDETLYFGSSRDSRKTRNFAHNPAAGVHLESGDDAVIFEGAVEEVPDKALLRRLNAVYAAKYPPYEPDFTAEPDTVVYRLRPRTAFAWREQDFPRTATRWVFG